MSALDRKRLDIALRYDFRTFIHMVFSTLGGQGYVPNWHIDAMAYDLTQCADGKTRRQIINLPPRNLKSICASVALPAWILGHDPARRIICFSYSAELAAKHSRECKAVIESDWYRRIFQNTRISRAKNTETNFETTRRGYRFATSVGGTLTGVGGGIVIVDDPLSSGDAYSKAKRTATNEWFDSVVYSRLDDKLVGTIILVSQRQHIDDLTGHVLRSGSWRQLVLPAIAEVEERIEIGPDKFHIRSPGEVLHEAREPRAILDQLKVELGSHRFSAQYQQCPTPEDGEIVKWEWFQFYDEIPAKKWGDRIVQSWDTAMKSGNYNDYSVCLTFLVRDNNYYLLDVFREKLNYPELKFQIVRLADKWRAQSYIVEDKGSGTSVISDIRNSVYANISKPISYTPVGDKVSRMMTQSAKIEARQVYLPRQAPWLGDFHDELLQFPHGRFDDQVDALAQFLDWIDQRQRNRTVVTSLDGFWRQLRK